MMSSDGTNMDIGSRPVILMRRDGEVLYRGSLFGIPICEQAVCQMSMQFFGDPDPCYKRRGAVYMRIWSEFEQFLDESGENEIWIDHLPENLLDCLILSDS